MVICESTLFCDRTVLARKESVGGEIASCLGLFIVFSGKDCVGSCLICTRKCRVIRGLIKFSLMVIVSMKEVRKASSYIFLYLFVLLFYNCEYVSLSR